MFREVGVEMSGEDVVCGIVVDNDVVVCGGCIRGEGLSSSYDCWLKVVKIC